MLNNLLQAKNNFFKKLALLPISQSPSFRIISFTLGVKMNSAKNSMDVAS